MEGLIVTIILLSLVLIISGITSIQYYLKNKKLVIEHLSDKAEWNKSQIDKNNSIDNYLNSLKSRFEKEYDSLKNKKKRGYMKGYYIQGSGDYKKKVETYNFVYLEEEYENGDIRVSLDDVEYIKEPTSEREFTIWIKEIFVSFIEKKDTDDITWLISKTEVNDMREKKLDRILEFIEEEKEKYENNSQIPKEK